MNIEKSYLDIIYDHTPKPNKNFSEQEKQIGKRLFYATYGKHTSKLIQDFGLAKEDAVQTAQLLYKLVLGSNNHSYRFSDSEAARSLIRELHDFGLSDTYKKRFTSSFERISDAYVYGAKFKLRVSMPRDYHATALLYTKNNTAWVFRELDDLERHLQRNSIDRSYTYGSKNSAARLAQGKKVDLVICGIDSPAKSGWTLASELSKLLREEERVEIEKDFLTKKFESCIKHYEFDPRLEDVNCQDPWGDLFISMCNLFTPASTSLVDSFAESTPYSDYIKKGLVSYATANVKKTKKSFCYGTGEFNFDTVVNGLRLNKEQELGLIKSTLDTGLSKHEPTVAFAINRFGEETALRLLGDTLDIGVSNDFEKIQLAQKYDMSYRF